jgi:hypothetical protein
VTVKFGLIQTWFFSHLLELFNGQIISIVHSNDIFVIFAELFLGHRSLTNYYSDPGRIFHAFFYYKVESRSSFVLKLLFKIPDNRIRGLLRKLMLNKFGSELVTQTYRLLS